jgi:hypothetical protein
MKADLLEQEFAALAVHPDYGALLLEPPVALRLITRASEEGVPILGVDGFDASDVSSDTPDEHTIDFSAEVAGGHGCWSEAEAFIRARDGLGLLFEVVLGDDPVESV